MSRPVEIAIFLGAIVGALGLFMWAIPWLARPFCQLILMPHYRLVVLGREHVPESGPVLLAANHVTWVDGAILMAAGPRRAGFLVYAPYISLPVIRRLAWRAGLIPVPASGPRAQRAAIQAARDALDRGEVVGIFPEGQLSRTGRTGTFLRGLEVIVNDRPQVAVVPVFMDNLWGSSLSYSDGRTLWKWPRGFRRRVVVAFGPPVPPPVKTFDVRQAVLEAGVQAFAAREKSSPPLETLDSSLPRLDHPDLGLLAASTPDFDRVGIRQIGQKPGTVGQAVPGVALRIVDESGQVLPPDTEGRLQALTASRPDWIDTGYRAELDREGFASLREPPGVT